MRAHWRRPVFAYPQKARETRYAVHRQTAVAVGDPASHGRWSGTLAVGESASQAEAQAVGAFDDQRAEHTLVLAFTSGVPDHPRFGVCVGFEFQQMIAAPRPVEGAAVMQHQSFAACSDHGIEPGLKLMNAVEPKLDHGFQPVHVGCVHEPPDGRGTFGETTRVCRQIEHHEPHPAPASVIRLKGPYGTADLCETPAGNPQLTLHGYRRPALGEPLRRVDDVSRPGSQSGAVPAAAHSIEFLADEVVGDAGHVLVDRGEHRRPLGGLACPQRRRQAEQQQAENAQSHVAAGGGCNREPTEPAGARVCVAGPRGGGRQARQIVRRRPPAGTSIAPDPGGPHHNATRGRARMIDAYSWTTPNGDKLHIMLEETGLEYRLHPVNIGEDEQDDPDYRAINPNGKIPAIVDSDGDEGRPLAIMESGAILLHLARRAGMLLPQAAADRSRCLQWLFFQVGHVGPMFGQAHYFNRFASERVPYAIERYNGESARLMGVLEQRLTESEYLSGTGYTIADVATWPWVRSGAGDLAIEDYPAVARWMDTVGARPAVQRGIGWMREG